MILAIDVGGTKTLVASFSDEGEPTEQIKFETPKDYPTFIGELVKTVGDLQQKEFRCCVIAMPGQIDRKHGVVLSFGQLGWTDVPIKADLQTALPGLAVYVENDAKLAGLYEAHTLPDYKKVLYLTVSTGIGGGLIVSGKIDPLTQDAEYGQMLFEHEGALQRWEAFASGKAIYNTYHMRAADISDTGIWYKICRNIALGLIDVIAATTPDIVVIGGGVGSHFDKFGDELINELKLYENNLVHVPPVVGAQHAEEAVIYGCYTLAMQKL